MVERVPVALICYNRPQHLGRVIQALNEIKPEPLYVFSDGPKNDADVERVKQVRRLLLDIKWTAPIVHIQETNRGLAKSIVGAVDYLLERHDTAVILEDDCVPGPRFMDFMTTCLEKYQGSVMSISGYAYPLPKDTFQGYPYHAFCFPRPETWGWATWRGAWKHYVRDGELASKFEETKRLGVDLRKGGNDIPAIIRNKLEFGRDSWSPGWLLGTAMMGGLTVYPTLSHIEYIGDDGSGVNMPSGGRWRTQMFDGTTMHLPNEPSIYEPAYRAMKGIFDGL